MDTMENNKINSESSAKQKNEIINKQKYKWSQTNVENARRKINKDIFERDKQASIMIKLDDMAVIINDKIQRRGIQRGFVNIQEDFNKNLLKIEKIILQALLENNIARKYNFLIEAKHYMKVEIWSDIRFLMVNKAITPGEITDLIRRQKTIDTEINRWITSIH